MIQKRKFHNEPSTQYQVSGKILGLLSLYKLHILVLYYSPDPLNSLLTLKPQPERRSR